MRRLTVRLIAALIGLLALFECAAALTSVSVTGTVRDQDGAVVVGAHRRGGQI
jgi:hypothetical protein